MGATVAIIMDLSESLINNAGNKVDCHNEGGNNDNVIMIKKLIAIIINNHHGITNNRHKNKNEMVQAIVL